jgi:hypothetical protein
MKKIFATLSSVVLTACLFAQAPQKMSYQAVVRDSNDKLVTNQVVGMQISILRDSPTEGKVVYTETQTVETNANGLVSINIGGKEGFENIVWANGEYYVKTEIDLKGGTNYTITGTYQILSVPYAFYAEKAGSIPETDPVWSGVSSDYYTKNDLQTEGKAMILFANLTQLPTTLAGHKIKDAVDISSKQIISGIKTFNDDLRINGLINGLTIGQGNDQILDNTVIGKGALSQNTTGFNNTAIGVEALYANTTGNHGTSIGYKALSKNTTGNYNTAIGYSALGSNTIGNYNMAIGNFTLQNNTDGYRNTAIGNEALRFITGNRNTAIGAFALESHTSGDRNTVIGAEADVALSPPISNATAIGYAAFADASNKVRIGNSDVKVIEGQVNWSVASDIPWIENIEYSNLLGLNFVKGLKTATFNYKNDSTKKLYNGLIAQDVQEVLKKLELSFSGLIENDNHDKTLNLSYADFVIPLINAVQEQQKEIEELKAEIALLKSK